MSSSKYSDGKVLRSKETTLFAPDLIVLRNGLEGLNHNATDLRTLDEIVDKINNALEEGASELYTEYTDALNAVELEVGEKNITNDMAIEFLREQATRPIVQKHADVSAPDVLISLSDWTWIKRKWNTRENFAGDTVNRKRTLRLTDVIEKPLGYKLSDGKVRIEGDDDEAQQPKLKAV